MSILIATNALAAVPEQGRQEPVVQGGVRPATMEFSLKHVVIVAAKTFAPGLAIGAVV